MSSQIYSFQGTMTIYGVGSLSDEYAGDGGEEEHQEEANEQEYKRGADGEAGCVEDSEAGIPVQE